MVKNWIKFLEMIFIKNKIFATVILLLIWHILSKFNDPIILPSPKLVFISLLEILENKTTYFTIANTLYRALIGLILTFILGISLGVGISLHNALKEGIMPLVKLLQSIPVISWILLSLIWFKIDLIPIFILLTNTLPIVIINVYEGIKGVDKKLLEMSSFFKVNKRKIIKNLYIPSIISHIIASSSIILSSSFKIVIMSEIITKINTGIGSSINEAWINIETEKVLAWTIIAVFFSLTIDYVVSKLIKMKLGRYYA